MNKLELVRKYEENAQAKIDERAKWWKEAREAYYNGKILLKLPELPESPADIIFGENSATFRFRYDKFLITKILKIFEGTDWRLTWQYREEKINDNWSDPCYQYCLDDFEVTVRFSDKIDGSTCTRKQIGKEMREVPVYEWNCEETK